MIDSNGDTVSENQVYCLVRTPYQVRLKLNYGPGEKVCAPESVVAGWELRGLVDRIDEGPEEVKAE